MKKIILNMLILVSLIIPLDVFAKMTSDCKELIDINRLTNLTLNYSYDDNDYSGVIESKYTSYENDFFITKCDFFIDEKIYGRSIFLHYSC